MFLYVSSASQTRAEGRGAHEGFLRQDSEAIETWNAAPLLLHDNLRPAHYNRCSRDAFLLITHVSSDNSSSHSWTYTIGEFFIDV